MAKLGKEQYLMKLISKKTKIKVQDVFDVLASLPECVAEAFFQEEPAEKEHVNFGAFTAYWKNTNLGPGIFFEPSKVFLRHSSRVKYEQKTLLATHLYEKLLPINKERIQKSIEFPVQNIVVEKPENPHYQANYAAKAKENRQKLKAKRKEQAKSLKNANK